MRHKGSSIDATSGEIGKLAKLTITERSRGGLRVEAYRPDLRHQDADADRRLMSRERDATKAEAYRTCSHGRARAAGKILGTARFDEHGAALARSREAGPDPQLLAAVYGWFTEGFDTLDLKEAKALLHELA
jgi:predicted ATPase